MGDDTQVDIDISVNGTPSLNKAADALAAVNQSLRDAGASIAVAVKRLDKLEKSLAGNIPTQRGMRTGIDATNKALRTQTALASVLAASFKSQRAGTGAAPGVTDPSIGTMQGLAMQAARDAAGRVETLRAAEAARTLAAAQAEEARQAGIAARAHAHNQRELERSSLNYGRVTAANNTFGQATQQSYSRLQLFNFALNENADHLPRIRYAMYDVAATLGIVGAAITAATLAPVAMAIQYERSFADVRRTTGLTGEAAEQLEQDLIGLSQVVPISYQQITQIATLAGQLGIANTNVENFTETVARFSATTDVTVDAAATAFGRLDSLLDDVRGNYEALGSSILNVGINSVATESQIIQITSQIAATGSQAGLAAHEVIGLSGALASLGVAPEAARGTILRVFSQINSAISGGGERLESFARVAGMTGEEFEAGWSEDFTGTFTQFLEGINSQGIGAETALRALGITAARDVNTMLKLSQNFQDVAEYLGLAKEGFEDATQLGANFDIIAGTVASKLEVLTNNLQALIASIGDSSLGPIGAFVDLLNGVLSGLQNIVSSPVGQWFAGLALIIGGLTGAITLMAAATGFGIAGLLAFKTVTASTTVATLGLSGAVATLGTAIKVGLISTGIGIAVVLIGTLVAGIMQLSGAFDTAADRANDYFGDISGLTDAIRRDNQAMVESGAQFAEVTTSIKTVTDVMPDWVDQLETSSGAQVNVADSLASTTEGLDTQTYALRDNAKAWLANTLANDENVQEIFAMREDLAKFGFNPDDFIASILGDPQAGAQQYIAKLQAALAKEIEADLIANGQFLDAEQVGLGTAEEAFREASIVAEAYSNAVGAAADQTALFAIVQDQLGSAADGTTELFGEATKEILDNVDAIYESANAQAELESNTQALGEAFSNQGAAAAASGSEMQSVIASIINTSATTGQAKQALQGLFDAIVAGGYASASQLMLLQNVIASLVGPGGATAFNMTPFTNGMKKAGSAGGGAAKKIRTLVDYANDLQKIMSRSFEIRFGSLLAMDNITDKFNDLNDELTKYMIKLQELQANRAVQMYFLSVAEAYDDQLRAGVLRAEIAGIDQDIADAQTVTNKTLVGNSEAAIENRKVITDLITDYQDYIQALAASGASQSTLQGAVAQSRAAFLAQAQALGFALPELQNYSVAFDDMAIAIDRVPRNITVSFDPNPALQALNEFVAQARSAGGSAGAGFAAGMQEGFAKSGRAALLQAEINKLITQMGRSGYNTSAAVRIGELSRKLASGNYAQGGAIRGPGTATSDSILINASDGEFMMRQKAVAGLGTPLLNYMNKYGSLPGFAGGGQIGTPAPALLGGVIELGPKSLGILRDAVNREVGLYLDPMGVARLSDQGHKQMAYGG